MLRLVKRIIKAMLKSLGLLDFFIDRCNKCLKKKGMFDTPETTRAKKNKIFLVLRCGCFRDLYYLLIIKRFNLSLKGLYRLIILAKNTEDHYLYQKAIKSYDDKINFSNYKEACFIGQGSGKNTLNTYRKLITDENVVLFEKIYKNDSACGKRMQFFYNNINEDNQVKAKLLLAKKAAPSLIKKIVGHYVTIYYYEYFESTSLLNPIEYLESSFYLIQQLAMSDKKIISYESVKYYRENHEINYIQKNLKSLACKRLGDEANTSKKIELLLKFFLNIDKTTRLVFSHGDLHRNNMSNTGIIFDWDSSGFYPEGHDYGKVLSYYFHYVEVDKSLKTDKQVFEDVIKQLSDMGLFNRDDLWLEQSTRFYFFAYALSGYAFNYTDNFLHSFLDELYISSEKAGFL
jgi:hypothetical protein